MQQYNNFAEYIGEVCNQVRLKKAHEDISKELNCHLEEQAEAYKSEGMESSQAAQKAMQDMGDATAVGGQLDSTHRPKASGKLLFFAGLMIAVAVLMQVFVHPTLDYYVYLSIGIAVCVGLYFFDYTLISKYAGVFFLILLFIQIMMIMGGANFARGVSYDASFTILFVPLYCAILYNMRGKKHIGIAISIVAMLIPVFITLLYTAIVAALMVGICCYIMLVWAAAKGWFGIDKKHALIAVVGVAVVAILLVLFFVMQQDYRVTRIKNIFFPGADSDGSGFIYVHITEALAGVQLIGASTTLTADHSFFDLSLANVAANYGILPVIGIIVILVGFIFYMFKIALKQKNSFARILALGCTSIYTAQSMLSILLNFGFMGYSTAMPFLYSSGSMVITNLAVLGVFLSACKWNGVVSEETLFSKRKMHRVQ